MHLEYHEVVHHFYPYKLMIVFLYILHCKSYLLAYNLCIDLLLSTLNKLYVSVFEEMYLMSIHANNIMQLNGLGLHEKPKI